jgi:hypothetical protein
MLSGSSDRMKRGTRGDVRADERAFAATGGERLLRGRELDGTESASRFKFPASRRPETSRLDSLDVMFNALRTGDLPCTWKF